MFGEADGEARFFQPLIPANAGTQIAAAAARRYPEAFIRRLGG